MQSYKREKTMVDVVNIERKVEWGGSNKKYKTKSVDGVVIIIDDEGKEHYVPFRANDKGGRDHSKEPYIWQWTNPQDPIGDATIYGNIKLENKEVGKIIKGNWKKVKCI